MTLIRSFAVLSGPGGFSARGGQGGAGGQVGQACLDGGNGGNGIELDSASGVLTIPGVLGGQGVFSGLEGPAPSTCNGNAGMRGLRINDPTLERVVEGDIAESNTASVARAGEPLTLLVGLFDRFESGFVASASIVEPRYLPALEQVAMLGGSAISLAELQDEILFGVATLVPSAPVSGEFERLVTQPVLKRLQDGSLRLGSPIVTVVLAKGVGP